MFVTNGLDDSTIHVEQTKTALIYKGSENEVTGCPQAGKQLSLEVLPELMPNRNAHYRLAQWVTHVALSITLNLRLKAK